MVQMRGANRGRAMSEFGGKAEDIHSGLVFRILTQPGSRRDKASARNSVQSSWDCFFPLRIGGTPGNYLKIRRRR
jgi:hypothetical protein